MLKALYDPKHNVLIMELVGRIDAAQMERFVPEVQKVIPKHGKGFRILTDLSGVQEVALDTREPIKKLMDFLDDQGVTEILRVIPDPVQDIGLNIMSLFHYSKDVRFFTFQSRKEAESRLEYSIKN